MKYSTSVISNKSITWTFLSPNEDSPNLHIKIANTNMMRRHFMLLCVILSYYTSKSKNPPTILKPLHFPVDICSDNKNDKLSGQSVNMRIADNVVTLQVPHVDFSYSIKLDDFTQMVTAIMRDTLGLFVDEPVLSCRSDNGGSEKLHQLIHCPVSKLTDGQGSSTKITHGVMLIRKKDTITVGLVVMDRDRIHPELPDDGVVNNYKTYEPSIQLVLGDDNVFKPGRIA